MCWINDETKAILGEFPLLSIIPVTSQREVGIKNYLNVGFPGEQSHYRNTPQLASEDT